MSYVFKYFMIKLTVYNDPYNCRISFIWLGLDLDSTVIKIGPL